MTPGPGGKPSLRVKAMVKGTDRAEARFPTKTGMIGKGPRLPPNTLLGDKTTPEEPIVGMTTRSSIALMITCMHQAVTQPLCNMAGAVAM